MTTNKNTNANRTNAIRRLIVGAILGAAPLLIAVGTATAAHAETTTSNSPDPGFHAPAHHEAFPDGLTLQEASEWVFFALISAVLDQVIDNPTTTDRNDALRKRVRVLLRGLNVL